MWGGQIKSWSMLSESVPNVLLKHKGSWSPALLAQDGVSCRDGVESVLSVSGPFSWGLSDPHYFEITNTQVAGKASVLLPGRSFLHLMLGWGRAWGPPHLMTNGRIWREAMASVRRKALQSEKWSVLCLPESIPCPGDCSHDGPKQAGSMRISECAFWKLPT